MSERGPIGQVLDALGIERSKKDGDMIDAAIVVMHVVDAQGQVRVSTAWSEGMDWVTRRGLLEAARDSERIPPTEDDQ